MCVKFKESKIKEYETFGLGRLRQSTEPLLNVCRYNELQAIAQQKLAELLQREEQQKEREEADRLRRIQDQMEAERKRREQEEASRVAEEMERERKRQIEEEDRNLRLELEERRRLEEEERRKIEVHLTLRNSSIKAP